MSARFPGTGPLLASCAVLLLLAGFLARQREVQGARRGPVEETAALAPKEPDWSEVYALAGLDEVRAEIETLRRFMHAETIAYYEAQFAAGNYERVPALGSSNAYPIEIGDDLAAWRYLPDSRYVAKVVLPRQGFERAYEARDRTAWLIQRESELARFEAR